MADIAGISSQQVAVSFRFFNRAVGEAALGTKSAVKVFGELGMNIRDQQGNIKPTDELLFEFSDKLAGIKDESVRTALAMRTLGRGGAALLPILSSGSAELRTYFKDVEALGGGFNEAFVENARKAQIEMVRLKMATRSMLTSAIGPLLPVLRSWADRAIKLAAAMKHLSDRTYAFSHAIQFLIGVAAGYSAIKTFLAVLADPVMYAGIALLVGTLTALYIIFDDLSTWAQGGKSVFGDMIDSIAGKGASAQLLASLSEQFTQFSDAMRQVGVVLKDVVINGFRALGESMPMLVKLGTYISEVLIFAVTALSRKRSCSSREVSRRRPHAT